MRRMLWQPRVSSSSRGPGFAWRAAFCAALAVLGCHHKKNTTGGTAGSTSSSLASGAASGTGAPTVVSHEGMRPPKPKATAAVTPPNLPTLGNQRAVHVTPPRGPQHGETYPCGSVWTGDDEIPLECDAPVYEQHTGTPAVALIPYGILRTPKTELPSTVDHRLDGFEGRTLKQGKAGACTAFSLTSQLNHALGLWTGTPGDISVMQVWARYHVGNSENAVHANVGRTIAADATWPYDAERAKAWMTCHRGKDCLNEDERHKLEAADKHGVVALEQIEKLPSDDTLFDVMQAKLAAGRDVGTGGRLPRAFRPIGDPGSKYIPDFKGPEKGGHAFSIVGYTHVGQERYFLVKNSWGEKWGDGGYGWIHETSLRKIIHGGYVVIVDPVAGIGLRRHRRKAEAVAACPSGEAPDSVDTACKPLCPDGGPRHAGYCGTTEDCTKGFVNVAGECVLAAPRAKGVEPKTNISFACATSGCVYTIPKGVGGCKDGKCQKSCPAPDFRLGQGRGGLLCLE